MDQAFDITEWRPTRPPQPGDTELDAVDVLALAQRLRDQTKEIQGHPYDPNTWLRRANTLTRLRYPELAVGDAHKSGLLCRAHLDDLNSCNKWRLGHRMAFKMHDPRVGSTDPNDSMLHDYLKNLQKRAGKVLDENMQTTPNEGLEGSFRRRQYPWMSIDHRQRSDDLLDLINEEFSTNAANAIEGEPNCVVKRHAFGDDSENTRDLLGVFSARSIEAGNTVLTDRTTVWGCNGPGKGGDLDNL